MINLTPLKDEEVVQHTTIFAQAIANAARDLCGVDFTVDHASSTAPIELNLTDVTIFTNFTGTVQGNYSINMCKGCAAEILGVSIEDDENEFDTIASGLFEEILNVATGKTIENLKAQFGFLTFNSPVITLGKIRFPRYRSCSIYLTSIAGNMSVNFAINMANLEITDKLLATMKNLRKQQSISYKDALTGIYNRAYFEYFKSKLFGHKRPLSLKIFDVDKFKDINDSFGHNCGDKALKHIADMVNKNIRDTDIPIRYGGDEFIILLEESPLVGAIRLIERISNSLNSTFIDSDTADERFSVAISAGIAEHVSGESFEELFRKADKNLYKAKNAGRNQFCFE